MEINGRAGRLCSSVRCGVPALPVGMAGPPRRNEREERIMDAIDIIHHEHSRIATVLQCLDRLAERISDERTVADLAAFEAIIDYLQSFPERFHHPKENEYLFAALEQRAPELAPTIRQLKAEHAEGEQRLNGLSRALEDMRAGREGSREDFRRCVADYVAFERDHMRTEETAVMPSARAKLSEEEMLALQEAFSGHADPLFDAHRRGKYNALYTHLLDVIPAPDGFAPPWTRAS